MGRILSRLALTVVEVILIEAVVAAEVVAVIKVAEKAKRKESFELSVL